MSGKPQAPSTVPTEPDTTAAGVGETPEVVQPGPDQYIPLKEDQTETAGPIAPRIDLGTLRPRIRNGHVSALELHVSALREFCVLTFKPSLHIKPWGTSYAFPEAYLTLLSDVVNEYDGIIADVAKSVNALDKEVTAPTSLGFDIWAAVARLKPSDRNSLVERLNKVANESVTSTPLEAIKFERVMAAADEREFELQRKLSQLNLKFEMTPGRVRDFLMHLNNEFVSVAPLPTDYSPIFNLFFHQPVSSSYGLLMDLVTPLRDAMIRTMSGWIRNTVQVKSAPASDVFTSVLNLLNVTLNVFDSRNSIASAIAEGRAATFIVNLLTAVSMSRWVRLRYVVELSDYNPTVLIECILLKLLTPKRVWSDESIAAIDNYIALHLVMRLAITRNANVEVASFYSTTKNLLPETLVGAPELVPFLVTTSEGGGWSGAGLASTHSILRTQADEPFFPWPLVYESIYAIPATEQDRPFPQLINFIRMVDRLTSAVNAEGRRTTVVQRNAGSVDISPVIRVLSHVSQLSSTLTAMARAIEFYMRQLSYVSICGQRRDSDGDVLMGWTQYAGGKPMSGFQPSSIATAINDSKTVIQRTDVVLKRNDALPVPFMTRFGGFSTFGWLAPNIFQAWAIHNGFSELSNRYSIALRYIPKPATTSDRVRWAIATCTTPMAALFKVALEDTRIFVIPQTSNSVLLDKIRAADEFVTGRERLHGFVRMFTFNDVRSNEAQLEMFKWHNVGEGRAGVTISLDELRSMTESQSLVPYVHDAVRQSKSVIFDMPIPVSLTLATTGAIPEDSQPLAYMDGVAVRPINVNAIWADDALQPVDRSNQFAFLKFPQFSVSELPFMLISPSDLLKLVRLATVRKTIRFFGGASNDVGFRAIIQS
jgi:hypothetical protein